MVRIDAAPNGIPSVHTSTALLMVWFCRKSRMGFVLAFVYLLLIVAATLASGQHYAVDLLAAVPYTVGVLWLAKVVALRFRVPKAEAAQG
jgi:membrane-associated phospholipid phosphatase